MENKRFSYRASRMLIMLGLFFIPFMLFAQQKQIVKGRVVDSTTKESLIGVVVAEKGTTNGTVTDIDGNFSLNVSPNSVITINYLGFKGVDVNSSTDLSNIQLIPATTALDEVVVVGYGVQKKSVVTAAISQVKADQLDKGVPLRLENALKGKVSGVTIIQGSGQPGEGSTVRIRGIGTINNSDPLYIVDGMPIGGGIDFLNPSDIESVEVLKDAASAAIYGARAANGVILVSTKKGTVGKTTFTYDFSYGLQNPWKKRAVLDATQYETLMNEMYLNSGQKAPFANPQAAGKGTDWQDAVFNYDAPVINHQVSASGGSDKGSYFLGFGYTAQDGIVGGNYGRSNYERYNVRLNNNYTLLDETQTRNFVNKFRVGANLSYSRIINTGVSTNSEWGSPLGGALMMSPNVPVFAVNPEQTVKDHPYAIQSQDGQVYTIVSEGFNEITNPVAGLELPPSINNSDKIVANFWGELDLLQGLKFRTSYGVDMAFWGSDSWSPEYYLGKTTYLNRSETSSSKERGFTWLLENTLTYNKAISEKHNFTLLVGQSAQAYDGSSLWGKGYDLPYNNSDLANINGSTAAQKDRQASGGRSQHRLSSYFTRLSYNFDERYMFEATIRRDGSANFGANNRWGNFPSVSGGWVVSKESFVQDLLGPVTFLKLRASWGKNGNEAIPAFSYTSVISLGSNYYFGDASNQNMQIGAKPARIANPDLKWEESIQTDLGFDAHFFNSSLTLGFDWFNKRTKGMLMEMPIPSFVGEASPLGNVGTVDNKGFEVELGYKFNIAGVKLNVLGNMSYIKNELIKLGNETGYQNWDSYHSVGTLTRAQNGLPFPFFYGFKTDGIFQNWDEVKAYTKDGALIQPKAQPGDVRFLDLDGDGKITDEDRTKIGRGMPDVTYGFTLGGEWKNFDASIFLQGVAGVDVYDVTRRIDLADVNLPVYMLDRWTGEGTSNSVPRLLISSDNENWRSSDLYIQNGAYLRLKTAQLGYTIPATITRKAFLKKVRVFVEGENLLTFTSYRGFDPEIGSGIDRGVYPQARTISIGASVNF